MPCTGFHLLDAIRVQANVSSSVKLLLDLGKFALLQYLQILHEFHVCYAALHGSSTCEDSQGSLVILVASIKKRAARVRSECLLDLKNTKQSNTISSKVEQRWPTIKRKQYLQSVAFY